MDPDRSGISLTHVPYKSITAITQDMQGGMINIGFTDVASAMPFVKQGRLKVLGLTGSLRSPGLPAVPLMSEQGVDFTTDGWYGCSAEGHPAPGGVVNQSHRLLRLAICVSGSCSSTRPRACQSPEEFAKTVRRPKVWEQIARGASIMLDDDKPGCAAGNRCAHPPSP